MSTVSTHTMLVYLHSFKISSLITILNIFYTLSKSPYQLLSLIFSNMDSSQFCSGKALDKNCSCRRFTKKPSQDPDSPALCRDCLHPEEFHALPPSSIGGIFASYKDAAKIAGLKPSAELKALQSTATQETNAGLKHKAGDEEYGEPSKKKKVIFLRVPLCFVISDLRDFSVKNKKCCGRQFWPV
jgi:hypothetical protein